MARKRERFFNQSQFNQTQQATNNNTSSFNFETSSDLFSVPRSPSKTFSNTFFNESLEEGKENVNSFLPVD